MGITQQIGASSLIKPGVIDNAAARPASPYEGQMVYEKDTDMIAIWNGTAWRYIAAATATNGSVLQVQSITKTDTFTSTSGTMTDITGLSVSITPKSTSSKILIQATITASAYQFERAAFQIVRGSTAIGIADAAGSRTRAGFTVGGAGYTNGGYDTYTASQTYLDSPATTSATTYKLQGYTSNSAYAFVVNRSYLDNDNSWQPRGTSSITVTEIAG